MYQNVTSGTARLPSLFAIMMVVSLWDAYGANDLIILNSSAGPNAPVTVYADVSNSDPFNAFQFDLLFTSELEWVSGAVRLTFRATDHTVSATLISPGRLRVLGYSITNSDFTGSSGSILEIDFNTGTQPGNYPVTIENATLGGSAGNILDAVTPGAFTLLAPRANISSNEIDFGRVPLNQVEYRTLTITNIGNLDLVVSSISVFDERFSFSEALPIVLSPGNSQDINLRFYSSEKAVLEGFLTIAGNDPDGNRICSVKVTAYAVNELHVGSVLGRSGYEAEVPVTINNMEEFCAFQFSIELPSAASYIGGSALLSDTRKADHIISADTTGNRLTVIAYSPSNSTFPGNDGTVMTFRLHLEGQGGIYSLPVSGQVISSAAGENIISASYDGTVNIASPFISVNPVSVDFGNVSILDGPVTSLTVYNNGSDNLGITSFTIDDPAFSVLTPAPITILPGNHVSLDVRFSASDAMLHLSNLRVRHNDVVHDPLNIPLRAQSYVPNEIRVVDCQAAAAMRDTVFIELFNQSQVIGFQFDIEYPDGLEINPEEIYLTERKQDHFVMASGIGQNKLRVLSYSGTLQTFSGTEGTVLGIPVLLSSSLSGIYPLTISEVVISDQYGGSVETGYASGNISILAATEQVIDLTEGWNLVSFAVEIHDRSLEDLLGPLMAVDLSLKVQDEEGKAIERLNDPIGWINEIGHLSLTEGYKIRVSGNRSLIVKGQPTGLPMDIPLESGWNLTGYPSLTAQSTSSVYGPLAASGVLLKVQNETGAAIEPVGEDWFYGFTTVETGKGYKVKTNTNTVLTISSETKGNYLSAEKETIKPVHFIPAYKGNGLDHMNIYLQKPEGNTVLNTGDEIGVYDGDLCVGSVVVNETVGKYISVTVSFDDPETVLKDGFIEGNTILLRLWNSDTGEEHLLKQVEVIKGESMLFERMGSVVIKVFFENTDETLLEDAYPNPSYKKTTFNFRIKKETYTRLEVIDINGQTVKILVEGSIPEGIYKIEWDHVTISGNRGRPGVYFYRLSAGQYVETKNLIIL